MSQNAVELYKRVLTAYQGRDDYYDLTFRQFEGSPFTGIKQYIRTWIKRDSSIRIEIAHSEEALTDYRTRVTLVWRRGAECKVRTIQGAGKLEIPRPSPDFDFENTFPTLDLGLNRSLGLSLSMPGPILSLFFSQLLLGESYFPILDKHSITESARLAEPTEANSRASYVRRICQPAPFSLAEIEIDGRDLAIMAMKRRYAMDQSYQPILPDGQFDGLTYRKIVNYSFEPHRSSEDLFFSAQLNVPFTFNACD
jgi:hypothetical protein